MTDQPEELDKTGQRDERGRFLPGHEGVGGRPEGPSVTEAMRAYYQEHPEEFLKLLESIRGDPAMRKTIWQYFDGMPKQQQEISGTGLPVLVTLVRDDGSTSAAAAGS